MTTRTTLPAARQLPASQGRVLLIEDDPDAALFFTHVLTRRGGFHVIHRPDPCAALDLARCERWDLVVTDYDLPGMTGLDLVGRIRECAPALPVVLVTAHDELSLPLPPRAPDAVLSKPVSPAHLVTTAAALAARPRPLGNSGRIEPAQPRHSAAP